MIRFILNVCFAHVKKQKKTRHTHTDLKTKNKNLSKCVSHLNAWSLAWTCSPVLGSEVTDCVLVSRGHFPLMTVSGLKRTDCG